MMSKQKKRHVYSYHSQSLLQPLSSVPLAEYSSTATSAATGTNVFICWRSRSAAACVSEGTEKASGTMSALAATRECISTDADDKEDRSDRTRRPAIENSRSHEADDPVAASAEQGTRNN